MGSGPLGYKLWNTGRHILVLATAFALITTPLALILTHGPAAHWAAASMTGDMADEFAGHGHVHDQAENDRQDEGGPHGSHNPADHEHQTSALVGQAASALKPYPDKAWCPYGETLRHLTLEGPRRPPRSV